MSMTATACVTESCTSKGQVQCFGWHQGSRGTEWGQELWGGERTPPSHPHHGLRAGGGRDLTSPSSSLPAPREGGRAYTWRRNHHPFSLAMPPSWSVNPSPAQPRPRAVGWKLSSVTSRLGDLHKPLASAFLSVSGEGLNHIR